MVAEIKSVEDIYYPFTNAKLIVGPDYTVYDSVEDDHHEDLEPGNEEWHAFAASGAQAVIDDANILQFPLPYSPKIQAAVFKNVVVKPLSFDTEKRNLQARLRKMKSCELLKHWREEDFQDCEHKVKHKLNKTFVSERYYISSSLKRM